MAVAHGGDVDMAIGCLHGTDWNVQNLGCALLDEVFQHLGTLEGGGGLHQGAINIGAFAKTHASDQGRGYGLVGIQAGHHVDGDHADPLRRAFGIAVDRHPAGKGLDHRIRDWLIAIGPFLAKTGNGKIDHILPLHLYILVAQAKARHHAGAEAFHHDIRLRRQFLSHRTAIFGLQIQGDGAFAPVEGHRMGA